MAQQHVLTAPLDIAANALNAVLVDTSELPAVCNFIGSETQAEGVDVVMTTVDGEEAVANQVQPGAKLYVVVKNTTFSPVTSSVSVTLEEATVQPPG